MWLTLVQMARQVEVPVSSFLFFFKVSQLWHDSMGPEASLCHLFKNKIFQSLQTQHLLNNSNRQKWPEESSDTHHSIVLKKTREQNWMEGGKYVPLTTLTSFHPRRNVIHIPTEDECKMLLFVMNDIIWIFVWKNPNNIRLSFSSLACCNQSL